MLRSICIFCAISIGLLGTPAVACRNPDNSGYSVTVVRTQVPAKLPADAFVARIEVAHPEGLWRELGKGVRARVTRVVQGAYLGVEVIIRDQPGPNIMVTTSCGTATFGNAAGYVVGRPVGYENGVLVIQPEFLQTGPRRLWFDQEIKQVIPELPALRRLPALPRSGGVSPRSRRAR